LASNHNHLGDYAYALELHLEALEIAKNFGAKHIEVDIAQNLVYTYIELGEPEKGITIGEKALKLGNYEMTDGLRANLAAAYIKLEQFHDAIHHYEAMTQSTELNIRFVAWGRLAGLYSWTAQSEKSLTAIDEAFGIYKDVESHFGRARAVVSLLNYGNQKQLTTYKNEITEVQAYQLPPYLQKELDDALVNFHSSVKSS